MQITSTKDEYDLIQNALNSHAAVLGDYGHDYAMNHDPENARECIKEAGKCYDLSRKLRTQE